MRRYYIFLLTVFVLFGILFISCSSDVTVREIIPETETGGDLPVDNNSGDRIEPPVEWKADGILTPGEYLSEYGSPSSAFEIRWNTDNDFIYFGIRANTKGWLSIGLEPESRMNNADMILGMVVNGEAVVSDQFSTGIYGPHIPDTELGGTDDIIEYDGREVDGVTVIEFKRSLDTGDEYDKNISGDSVSLIWSYGSDDDFTRKHIARNTSAVTIKIMK
ncbi:MAG: hypothetical protein JSU58_11070 [Dehalococcoidales bacterium]|nr:MAG: hypothetical protein JSU58_11070 [Dehalococcoidales bacterium]